MTCVSPSDLSLCVKTRAPGTYLGTSKFKVMGLGTRHAATISILMLFVCGDVQLDPDPVPTHVNASIYSCEFCELHVNWSDAAVGCDECSHWFHKMCLSMSSAEFSGITNMSWKCIKCSTLNCSSFLYQGYNIKTSNPMNHWPVYRVTTLFLINRWKFGHPPLCHSYTVAFWMGLRHTRRGPIQQAVEQAHQ